MSAVAQFQHVDRSPPLRGRQTSSKIVSNYLFKIQYEIFYLTHDFALSDILKLIQQQKPQDQTDVKEKKKLLNDEQPLFL
jgi:hypothetical protein